MSVTSPAGFLTEKVKERLKQRLLCVSNLSSDHMRMLSGLLELFFGKRLKVEHQKRV